MSNVFANGRLVLHQGDGLTHIAAPPDVCKVPTPAGPVPTPFVNTAQDAMLAKGSKQTSIAGNPVALASSELSASTGDEPGTAGGVISSKIKGKLTWSGSSMDVKVEGKGVARFLDPTMHNGNTFNTAFMSNGSTGLAYGDDTPCAVCKKGLDNHRVLETADVAKSVLGLFEQMNERLHAQKPRLDEVLRLRKEKIEREAAYRRAADAKSEEMAPEIGELERAVESAGQLVRGASDDDQKAELRGELRKKKEALEKKEQELRQAVKSIKQEGEKEVNALAARMKKINEELSQMRPVLTLDPGTKTYIRGYMVGACICKCPQDPRMLAASSGKPTEGFCDAVAATPFTRVDAFEESARQRESPARLGRGSWECAAPKLLQAGGAGGHKVKTMTEKWYSPMDVEVTVTVKYEKTEGDKTTREGETFRHGQSVPSCETCQALIPEMLCDNQKECP
ncbi:DUF4150 domain-containing protein [Sorangium sp. So ce1078]|uniref:DUF4150 domain-containing protein n=1 Tax=Sorangium sp. So ce1078 TaxID=3133329 RepID=UPI003F622E5C